MSQSLRKVLIVSPHFPPVNTPDMQRVRLALPTLRALGWEPVVLAAAPAMVEGAVLEPLLEETYPSDIRIVRVSGVPFQATRWAGIGSLWWRCGRALAAAGERLLRAERFDLVFFSTTQFDSFSLGPKWRRNFGVPYVLDYQDPWVNDYYSRTKTRPPGGWLKFGFSQWNARRREPAALEGASAVMAVSSAYGSTLARNHPGFDAERVKFIPFGASERDFATVRGHAPRDPLINFDDGCFHHVYAGRCGPDMSTALKIIFRAFKIFQSAEPEMASRIRFHFVGTDYAPRPLGREWVMPTARDEKVDSFVSEYCYRVPYFDALYYLTKASALVAIGSNDPTYSASKIFPYVLARRPLLAVFHENSPVLAMANLMKCGERHAFRGPETIESVATSLAKSWFSGRQMHTYTEPDQTQLKALSAETMTSRLAACFEEACSKAAPKK